MNNAAIGIFDSGIGGLTVAHAINQVLPDEQIVYFGDTVHLPYGDKSRETIAHYSEEISKFLLSKGCKVIVIACNSASSAAYKEVVEVVQGRALVLNVIDPVIDYIGQHYSDTTIGLIGTKQTVNSGVYKNKIDALTNRVTLNSLATPLLVHVIEEGFCNTSISREAVKEYLSRPELNNIRSLILGCTHYPLLKSEIELFYQNQLDILDSAQIVANHLKSVLAQNQLLSAHQTKEAHHFYVSEYTKAFEESTKIFFGEKIKLDPHSIW